jgi:hypothetical protein
MKFLISSLVFFFCLGQNPFFAQNNIAAYMGGAGDDAFNDVVQLSNGNFLIAGNSNDLSWYNGLKTNILASGINNAQGTSQIGFLMYLSQDFKTILQLFTFPSNAVENVRFIKLSNKIGASTGDIFISGDTKDSKANGGGYFIAKLNNNFVKGLPTGLAWVKNIWAEGYAKEAHPWDVGSDGKVVYITGQSHAADWGAMHRTDTKGNDEVVENFRSHWKKVGGEYYGTASSFSTGVNDLAYSGMVFKNGTRCNFRSWTQSDYDAMLPDGNGAMKKGTWPLDVFFNSPCTPGTGPTAGPGYTGYKMGASQVWGASSIAIDRRDNHIYLGMNNQSVLPSGMPDFEPAVVAFDQTGKLKWWSRLYHEIAPKSSDKYLNSEPDQYIDGLAIDYNSNNIVVNARCHGNNVENLWEGNTVAAVPSAVGFQQQFTGKSGNIHISWLGKLQLKDGTLQRSTYVAEFAEGTASLGKPLTEPNMDAWNNPNDGWPDVNTTRLVRNTLKVTADGSVAVIGVGRRVMTTKNAFQKMPNPTSPLKGAWSAFVRVYQPDLNQPLYSSLLTGQWDTATGTGGDNTEMTSLCKVKDGIVVVGKTKTNTGNAIPTSNIPSWASAKQNKQDGIVAYFKATNLENKNDDATFNVAAKDFLEKAFFDFEIFPNPLINNTLFIKNKQNIKIDKISLCNVIGQNIFEQEIATDAALLELNIPTELGKGIYFIKIENKNQIIGVSKLIKSF